MWCGNLARRSGQCLGANEIRNCPRIWPCPTRVPKTCWPQSTYLASRSLQQKRTDLVQIWEQRIPEIWREAKIIALAKPGKDPHLSASYRSISLQSVCYKLLECTILLRISPTVEDLLSVDRAGFRRGRTTCDQVTALTAFIENGVEKTLKTGAVFLDLTAAYDTIWHTGLLYRLSKCTPYLWNCLR